MILEKMRCLSMPPATFARVEIDEENCSGCGRCVSSCPIQLLMIENKIAKSNERYDAFRCLTCQNCESVCPQDAIKIQGQYRVEKGFWKNDNVFSGDKVYPKPFDDTNGADYETYKDQLTDVEKVIYKRRSNRLYKKKQVAPELIKRVIEAGRFAPSAGNNQPWKFVVIQDPGTLDELNIKCKERLRFFSSLCLPQEWLDKKVPGDKTAQLKPWQRFLMPILIKLAGGDADQRAAGGLNAVTSDPDFHTFFNAPAVILILVDKRAIGGTELDIGICAQNMVLAAHSLGLGTCYVSLISKSLHFNKKYGKKFGIEDPFVIGTTLAIGHPRGKIDAVVEREQARIDWM